MLLFKLVLRGIQYHRRLHFGLAAGVFIACAALTGSLLVGYSVERTLYNIAVARLGRVSYAIDWGGRYFDAGLAEDVQEACNDGEPGNVEPVIAAVLGLSGVAEPPPERMDLRNRVNRARIYGIDGNFPRLFPMGEDMPLPGPQEVWINEETARRLALRPGDDLVLRIPKPSQVPAEAPLAKGGERDVVVARARVRAVLDEERGGRFSLAAEQAMPANLYVDRRWLGGLAGLPEKGNLLLAQTEDSAEELQRALAAAWRPEQIGLRLRASSPGIVQLESDRLFIEEPVVKAALHAGSATPVLTYLVNHIRHGDRATPYSFAIAGTAPPDTPQGKVCINHWLADALAAAEGDTVDFSWHEPLSSGGFSERSGTAVIHKVLSMDAVAVERDLAPRFPGLSDVNSCRDWDIGLPLEEAHLLDEANEAYWKAYGQTPKLLVPYETGRDWWGGLYGSVTAVRFTGEEMNPDALYRALRDNLEPGEVGLMFQPVRQAALLAVEQALDFGALFGGMSMFLIAAALLLVALLYAHGLQVRSTEMGALMASGWTSSRLRRWLLLESLPGCAAGAVGGALGGAGYARLLLFGLARFWPDAVAGTPVRYYGAPPALLARGMLITAGCVLVVFAIGVLRAGRRPVRELLQRDFSGLPPARGRVDLLLGLAALAGALPLCYALIKGVRGDARDVLPVFFALGMGVLVVLLCAYGLVLGYWGRRASPAYLSPYGMLLRQLARRRSRSLGIAVLTACGLFMVQSVVSMQAAMTYEPERRESGAGGFSVFAATTVPVKEEPGRILGLPRGSVVPLRVRDGDDAGCLNLNRARQPRIYGVNPDELAVRGAFASPEEAKTLWVLLSQPLDAGVFPALVGDTDTALWGLQARTDPRRGTEYTYQDGQGAPFRLRCAGKLPMRLSLFQGSLLISEENFVRLFPHDTGYRAFLIETPDAEGTTGTLNRDHGRLGMEAVPSGERLRGFYAVERAYLAMFLVLGGLGMMLGAGGAAVLVMRSLAERRAEYALLAAVGFPGPGLRRSAMIENACLVGAGLLLGSLAATIATLPLLVQSRHTVDYTGLAVLLVAVFVVYIASTLLVVRLSLQTIPLSALRRE